ncbi:MAG TPA: NAD-dependent epimerase/dehydratase family protein [Thermoanaerobaculia bacterium]|nr:NAD-dependent epimerase/dehydratase family protein [Thermoanaerobaculia bacterium]HUM28670.1 NAD-dependent epimerase/dehydratase family protein [Thermoanaerobaculia bacterium]HXK66722.1 NAD-dependent epimerase/dehydratase family protein [Thermoanaerobaculia bacterium]
MNVLVLGGTRFIGYACVQALLERGHHVTVLHRGYHPLNIPGVNSIKANREDEEAFTAAIKGRTFDTVLDLTGYTEKDARLAVRLFSGKVGHYLFISSASVYLLNQKHYPPYREEDIFLDPPDTIDHVGKFAYGYNKRKADLYFLRAAEEQKFPSTCIRLPVVTGPRDYTGRLASYYHRLIDGHPLILPEDGLNLFGFVYVDDIAAFIADRLGDRKTHGLGINLAQRETVTLKETILAMAHRLDVKPTFVPIPTGYLLRHTIGTTFSPLTNSTHVLLDTSRAASSFAFTPTPFRTWISQMVHLFRAFPAKDLFSSTRRHEIALAKEFEALLETPQRRSR